MSKRDFYGKSLFLWAVCLLAVALAGAAGVGLIRDYGRDFLLKSQPPHVMKADASLAGKWLEAVSKNDQKLLSIAASRIVPENETFAMPDKESCALISDFRIRLGFLTDPFNFADFVRWRDLVEMKAIAEGLDKASESPEPLMKAVMEKVKRPAEGMPLLLPQLSALAPWHNGQGSTEDRLRLLCGLAWQSGYDCQLLGLFVERGRLIGTLAMLRKGSRLWLASCNVGAIWECKDGRLDFSPVERFLAPAQLAALKGPFVYFAIPEPQDFRAANLALYRRLEASGAKGLPRFPEAPADSLAKICSEISREDFASYWNYPFMGLASIKGDPMGWLLPLK